MKQKKCKFCAYNNPLDAETCLKGGQKDGYRCTRDKGHRGRHVACGATHDLARWY